jgi:hypothetical protein
VAAGVVLILLGLALWWIKGVAGIGEAAAFFLIGGGFLAAYFYQKNHGYLVPAGILLGLGAGLIGDEFGFKRGASIALCLGLGFMAIFVIALIYERKNVWWPLIPGTALVLLALPDTEEIFRYLFDHWPLLLVIVGAIVLIAAFARPGTRSEGGG